MLTTLQGPRILLRPLQYIDADALLHAAADGELWNLTVTVVPSASTIDSYLKKGPGRPRRRHGHALCDCVEG